MCQLDGIVRLLSLSSFGFRTGTGEVVLVCVG
jgi:hypothetical protein